MAQNPAAQVDKVRVARQATEAYIDTAIYPTPAAQIAAAKALGTNDWRTRNVLQVSGDDVFEYDVVSSGGV
ncbi:hypothetical protein MEX01_52900 [Methylorubrum extorquens]|uniref:hypothetical protein n=1 Tax=Methylorubrum extorquens TaxID=408 RepID=UPI00116DC93D|nr:hypothetical protein [Methylorubrum extorquens]GEL44699.1 hypothetical protein MEX01_52900 [Methylorubrum extorquens]